MADDVPLGALASYEPPEHWLRRARRVAVDLQRILAGEDAGTLPVRLVGAPRLTLNLATARAIGFSPGYSILTEAELVGTDSLGPADTVSLADAMRGAVAANLDLKAADLAVESGAQNVRLCPLQPAPRDREPVRRHGDAREDRGGEPGPAARAGARRRALLLRAVVLGTGLGRLRLGAPAAAGPRSPARAGPARRGPRCGPGVHQRAAGPHSG